MDRFDEDHLLGVNVDTVYCLTVAETLHLGAAMTTPCGGGTVTGVHGSCVQAQLGNFHADIIFSCGTTASRWARVSQDDEVGSQLLVSAQIDVQLHGLAADGWTVSDGGGIYVVDDVGATVTKLRDTRLCVDEHIDNPFNGSAIGGLVAVQ